MRFQGACRPEIASHPDAGLTELANAQWGVVARWQLPAIGVTLSMLKTRIARGSMTRLHRGVYVVGHSRLTPHGHALAAVLAAGPGAALSHRSAAWLHGIGARGGRSDVTTTARAAGAASFRVHRTTVLTASDLTTVEAIPVTTVARTLVDLAGVVSHERLRKALSEAERMLLIDMCELARARERTRTRNGPGHARLQAVLAEHAAHGAQIDRSKLERRFVALARRAGLPLPRLNLWIDGMEVDAVWPRERIAVELDSWEFHRHRRAFQHDREKGNALTAAGWTVLRFTHHDIADRPAEVAAQLRHFVAPG
jgi:very-short-patch-repair endonuclease